MRKIKFRAWDKREKEMFYDNDVLMKGFCYSKESIKDNDSSIISLNQTIKKTNDLILMQFTGLKDCNGCEIYEGDIVKNQWGIISKIIWYDDMGCWAYTQNEITIATFVIRKGQFENEKMKIIGNIYENPELLKEKK